MFLNLAHTKLDIIKTSKLFVLACYKVSTLLPPEEKFNMVQQLRRVALSVHLNIAEGSSRKSEIERRRFYEIYRGSLVEIDSILDVAVELNYFSSDSLTTLGETMLKTFQMLSKMIMY